MSGPEPKVIAEDVRRILRKVIRPDDPDYGESVALLAERANTSTRTVYRALGSASDTISLGLADALVLAAGGHLSECRLAYPDGRVVSYLA